MNEDAVHRPMPACPTPPRDVKHGPRPTTTETSPGAHLLLRRGSRPDLLFNDSVFNAAENMASGLLHEHPSCSKQRKQVCAPVTKCAPTADAISSCVFIGTVIRC